MATSTATLRQSRSENNTHGHTEPGGVQPPEPGPPLGPLVEAHQSPFWGIGNRKVQGLIWCHFTTGFAAFGQGLQGLRTTY